MSDTKATSKASLNATAQSRSQPGAPKSTRPSTPPYNPGLQKLVDGKQAWAVPLDEEAMAKGFRGWHQRGYLPHYDAPGATQIVTLRLADSLPASRRGEWEHLLRIEDDRERRRRRLERATECRKRRTRRVRRQRDTDGTRRAG